MRLLDPLFAIRPLVLVPAWSFFLLGAAASPAGGELPGLRLAAFTLAMIGVHLVNQIVDLESDRINDKGYFLQRRIFTPQQYGVAAASCLVLAVGTAAATGQAPLRLAAAAALGLAYSVPPLRLAARPGFDLGANAAGYGLLAPWLGAGEGAPGLALLASTTLAVAAVFVHTTLLDLEGDRRTAKRTIGVLLGSGPARGLAAVLSLAAAAAAIASGDGALATAGAVLALGCAAALLWPARLTSRTLCVGGTAVYVVAAAAAWPIFAAVVLVLAVATRAYYARRFGVRYPAL